MIWVILLFANGTALLVFNQTLVGNIYSLQLPAAPLSTPVVLNNKTPVFAVLNGSTLLVPVLGRALITVEYVPKVKIADGVMTFNVTDGDYIIWAQGGVILMPALKILNFTRSGNSVLVIAEGPGVVAYTLQGSTPTNNTTPTPTTQTATQSTETQSSTSITMVTPTSTSTTNVSASSWLYYVVGIVLAIAAVGIAYGVTRRRATPHVDLNDTDRLVLSYLKKTGGAYEPDIARNLGLPRTTVFKSVRRLERLGLVSVEKRDGRNYVTPK
ncbi:MAG: helix-turn-helix domain-containing protein [Thermoproteus sp.]